MRYSDMLTSTMEAMSKRCSSTAVVLAVFHLILIPRATASTCSTDLDVQVDHHHSAKITEFEASPAPALAHALLQLHTVRQERVVANAEREQNQLQHRQQHKSDFQLSAFGRKLALAFSNLSLTLSTVVVFLAVLALCLFVAAVKYWIDYYEKSHIDDKDSPPWYRSETLQLKVGVLSLGVWIMVGLTIFTQFVHFKTSLGETDRMLTLIEACYLCAQILTTVGYGDYTPSRPEGQLFVACFILIGVVVVAVVVTEILKVAMRRGERAVAKAVGMKDSDEIFEGSDSVGVFSMGLSMGRSEESQADGARFRYLKARHKNFLTFVLALGPFLLSLAVGTAFFTLYPGENKSSWEAFYMSCVTLTSVGFGVFTPSTKGGELFASIWMLVGVGATANMIVSFGEWFFYSRRSRQAYDLGNALLAEMDSDGDGLVDRCEYLRFELIRCGMCQREDIDAILLRFRILDPNNSGIPIEQLRYLHEDVEGTIANPRASMGTGGIRESRRSGVDAG